VAIEYSADAPSNSLDIHLNDVDPDSPAKCENFDQFVFEGLGSFTGAIQLGTAKSQILTREASSNAWSFVGRAADGKFNRIFENVEISKVAPVGVYSLATSTICRDVLAWQRSIGQKVKLSSMLRPHTTIELSTILRYLLTPLGFMWRAFVT
jgi:hypothetical protein